MPRVALVRSLWNLPAACDAVSVVVGWGGGGVCVCGWGWGGGGGGGGGGRARALGAAAWHAPSLALGWRASPCSTRAIIIFHPRRRAAIPGHADYRPCLLRSSPAGVGLALMPPALDPPRSPLQHTRWLAVSSASLPCPRRPADKGMVKILADYVIRHHFQHLAGEGKIWTTWTTAACWCCRSCPVTAAAAQRRAMRRH